jgi:YbgC/YbaW family acyl-CoA thioester hydrolase
VSWLSRTCSATAIETFTCACSVEALEAAGFSWPVLAERDWRIFVVRIEVDYVAEARRGDRLRVRTWADGFRRTMMILAQEIVRDDDRGEVVARARVTAVWMGPDRRPMRVPDDVRAGLTRGARLDRGGSA